MSAHKRYKLIANPFARRGDAAAVISKVADSLSRRNVLFDLELTTGPKEAGMIAKAAGSYDVVVAVGGDGTVNEVAQGMLFTHRPMGVIPCGSGNDFVKSLNIPVRIEKAVDILLAGEERVIDAGNVNGHAFVNGVGIGFDAAVTVASRSFRRIKGLPLYLAALVKALGRFRPVLMTIELDGRTIRRETLLLTIGNGTTCGGGFKLNPRAKVDDGVLDVTMVRPMAIPAILRHLPDVFRGTIERVPYARMETAVKLTIESASPVPAHMDGEILTEAGTRFEIEVLPKALRVIGRF